MHTMILDKNLDFQWSEVLIKVSAADICAISDIEK